MGISSEALAMKVPSSGRMRAGDLRRFVLAAAVVAVLDISFAATYWVVIRGTTTFPRIMQSIAAGLLGKAAFEGGVRTVLIGAVLHCVVASGWTALFLFAARHWAAFGRLLQGRLGAIKTGMPFGILVWLVMNLVVVRLSRATPAPVASTWFWVSLAWHAVGVGLPIAIIIRE